MERLVMLEGIGYLLFRLLFAATSPDETTGTFMNAFAGLRLLHDFFGLKSGPVIFAPIELCVNGCHLYGPAVMPLYSRVRKKERLQNRFEISGAAQLKFVVAGIADSSSWWLVVAG
ncbi:hypothetical protein Nepgr_001075 [Nepenthes gracilis]|uniref:Uncharacterized protein n=1 Tax=Nepenthes gracilis TaxID=150966 RepID=A0AAD3P490_NEPGR|nr:hypothetical protein Nepgr_001075 [Nepenthes gracilis]